MRLTDCRNFALKHNIPLITIDELVYHIKSQNHVPLKCVPCGSSVSNYSLNKYSLNKYSLWHIYKNRTYK